MRDSGDDLFEEVDGRWQKVHHAEDPSRPDIEGVCEVLAEYATARKKSERTENGYGLKNFLRTLPDCCSVCICKQGRLSKNHSLTKTIRFQNEQKESKESVWVGVGAYCLLVAHASAHPV